MFEMCHGSTKEKNERKRKRRAKEKEDVLDSTPKFHTINHRILNIGSNKTTKIGEMFHDHPKKNDLVVHNNTRRTFIKMWDQMKNCIALCNLSFHKLGNNLCPFFSSLCPFLSSFLIAVLSCSELWANLFHFPSFLVAVLSCNKGVRHTVALPFTLKSILRQKKNYGNSNISPCKNIIFKKSSKRNQNTSRYYNSIANLKFQHKLLYHLSKILI